MDFYNMARESGHIAIDQESTHPNRHIHFLTKCTEHIYDNQKIPRIMDFKWADGIKNASIYLQS